MTTTVTKMFTVFGTINYVAALELVGYAYTVSNQTGISLAQVNAPSYTTITGTINPTTTGTWKLYQERVDNHIHRPIYAVQLSQISVIYRVTTTITQVVNDATLTSDFYNFNLMFSRYHAYVINPGTCG